MLSELGYKQIKLREDQFGKLRFTKASMISEASLSAMLLPPRLRAKAALSAFDDRIRGVI